MEMEGRPANEVFKRVIWIAEPRFPHIAHGGVGVAQVICKVRWDLSPPVLASVRRPHGNRGNRPYAINRLRGVHLAFAAKLQHAPLGHSPALCSLGGTLPISDFRATLSEILFHGRGIIQQVGRICKGLFKHVGSHTFISRQKTALKTRCLRRNYAEYGTILKNSCTSEKAGSFSEYGFYIFKRVGGANKANAAAFNLKAPATNLNPK